jgi:hypothetical protein
MQIRHEATAVRGDSMNDPPWDREITTADEFERALGELLLTAVRNDVEPRGSWVYRNGDVSIDWEVMVYELGLSGEREN